MPEGSEWEILILFQWGNDLYREDYPFFTIQSRSNSMSKSTDLLTVQEVAQFYGVSVQSIRRRIKESKENRGSFPSPVFGYGRKALFHRKEVEQWKEKPGHSG
jgi:excisionase family DNA binding protein